MSNFFKFQKNFYFNKKKIQKDMQKQEVLKNDKKTCLMPQNVFECECSRRDITLFDFAVSKLEVSRISLVSSRILFWFNLFTGLISRFNFVQVQKVQLMSFV